MKAALFLGCTVPVRAQNYELSARKVAEALGIELVDLPGMGCCGYPIRSVSTQATLWMAARALALAEDAGLELVSLCSACGATLAEAKAELQDEQALAKTQEVLGKIGLEYKGTARVRHFARYLFEQVGAETIASKVTRPLDALHLALHYGCHYTRPSHAHQGPDSPEAPHTIESLIRATSAQPVPYEGALRCCGGGILAVREGAALAMAQKKLDAVTQAQAHALVSVCPFCSVMYEGNQRKIEKESGNKYGLPVLYLTQVLGLALGISEKELGFKQNRVKPKALLSLLG